MAVELMSLNRVVEVTGMSRSLVYRDIRNGLFPASRAYKDHPTRRFWLSTEVAAWQAAQVGGDEFDALL